MMQHHAVLATSLVLTCLLADFCTIAAAPIDNDAPVVHSYATGFARVKKELDATLSRDWRIDEDGRTYSHAEVLEASHHQHQQQKLTAAERRAREESSANRDTEPGSENRFQHLKRHKGSRMETRSDGLGSRQRSLLQTAAATTPAPPTELAEFGGCGAQVT